MSLYYNIHTYLPHNINFLVLHGKITNRPSVLHNGKTIYVVYIFGSDSQRKYITLSSCGQAHTVVHHVVYYVVYVYL